MRVLSKGSMVLLSFISTSTLRKPEAFIHTFFLRILRSRSSLRLLTAVSVSHEQSHAIRLAQAPAPLRMQSIDEMLVRDCNVYVHTYIGTHRQGVAVTC